MFIQIKNLLHPLFDRPIQTKSHLLLSQFGFCTFNLILNSDTFVFHHLNFRSKLQLKSCNFAYNLIPIFKLYICETASRLCNFAYNFISIFKLYLWNIIIWHGKVWMLIYHCSITTLNVDLSYPVPTCSWPPSSWYCS